MGIISKDTARRIWCAHEEIRKSAELIDEFSKSKPNDFDLDGWGRRSPFQMSVPFGKDSHKLYDMSAELAPAVIRAHMARKQSELVDACEMARLELEPEVWVPQADIDDHPPEPKPTHAEGNQDGMYG